MEKVKLCGKRVDIFWLFPVENPKTLRIWKHFCCIYMNSHKSAFENPHDIQYTVYTNFRAVSVWKVFSRRYTIHGDCSAARNWYKWHVNCIREILYEILMTKQHGNDILLANRNRKGRLKFSHVIGLYMIHASACKQNRVAFLCINTRL